LHSDHFEDLTYDYLHSSEDNLWSILYLTGYLTKVGERDKDGQIELRIPNKEVKEIFESTVRKWFEDSARVTNRKDLFDAVWNKDADKATKEISTLLRMTISYYDYRENFYHAFLAGIFAGAGYSVESNREHGEGRSDIVIYNDVTGQVAVFEAKYSRKLEDLEKDCQKALDQINTKMYVKEFEDAYEEVLVPEIWIAFAEASGIPELKRTTRDEPDYDKLMNWRLGILKEHGLGLKEIQDTIAKIDPIPGAKEFLDELRSITQVIIISDTFTQFATPLMKKLGWPTIFCNSLEVADNGEITGFKMRCEQSKLTTVKALQSIGYDTIASGDSHNDLGMIKASKAGFLFKSTEQIKADNPELEAFDTYDELLAAIKKAL